MGAVPEKFITSGELALFAAIALLIALVSCERGAAQPPAPGRRKQEASIPDPCAHFRGPTVCTTDDDGEYHCSQGGRPL